MPRCKSQFRERWLTEIDENGHELKLWCIKGKSDSSGICTLCKTDIKCDNAGLKQILQHAKGAQHKKLSKTAFSPAQTKLTFKPEPQAVTSKFRANNTKQRVLIFSNKAKVKLKLRYSFSGQDVLSAEIVWAAKCAYSNISFRANEGIGDTFKSMFKCPIADGFSMSRSKISYLLSDGLGPAYSKMLLYDVKNSRNSFSIQYDETTQAQVKKQMDLLIRYWSPEHDEVWCRYYKSSFFAHADGKSVATAIIVESMNEDKVPMESLIALGSDGPNVNKTIFREVSRQIKDTLPNWSGLLDIDTCNLHTMHNAFSKGISEYGQEAEDLAIALFGLFKISSGRREDYKDIQLDLALHKTHRSPMVKHWTSP